MDYMDLLLKSPDVTLATLTSPLTNRAGAESMHLGVVQFET
jgi:hypothetical protein